MSEQFEDFDFDPIEAFAEDWDDLPEDTPPPRPLVWVLAKCIDAKPTSNKRVTPAIPQIQVQFEIIESAKDEEGKTARGKISDWLERIPKGGHPSYAEKRANFKNMMFKKAARALLAPGIAATVDADQAVNNAVRLAGSFHEAFKGRLVVLKLGINDGLDKKTGAIVSQARADRPVNRIDNYLAATEANVEKYVRGAVAS